MRWREAVCPRQMFAVALVFLLAGCVSTPKASHLSMGQTIEEAGVEYESNSTVRNSLKSWKETGDR